MAMLKATCSFRAKLQAKLVSVGSLADQLGNIVPFCELLINFTSCSEPTVQSVLVMGRLVTKARAVLSAIQEFMLKTAETM
eukprot:11182324-Lingulodinium_polyedra.AAC.1